MPIQRWSTKLARPVAAKDRATPLRTLADAREYALGLDPRRENSKQWQHAAELLMRAAETGETEAIVTAQLVLALMMDGHLDLVRTVTKDP